MKALRVLVNLLYLRPGKVGGSEVYCRELLTALSRLPGTTLRLVCLAEAAPSLAALPAERIVLGGEYSLGRRLALENGTLRKMSKDADILFSPANFGVALPCPAPQVVTIHDLQHAWFPEHFSTQKRVEREVMFRWTLRTAAKVIAISDFTRKDIERRYSPPPGRVVTVLEGVDLGARPSEADRARVRDRFDLTRPFFAYPATDNPHKDHDTAVRALAELRGTHPDQDVELIFTGARTDRYAAIDRTVSELGLSHHVRHLGFLDHADVFALLSLATGLIFPSRFEGFGLPVLEAMHSGTPVVASRAASIPEVAGDAALLVPPGDAAEFAAQMARLLVDEPLRTERVASGYRNLARFSWDRCAAETRAVFESAMRTPA